MTTDTDTRTAKLAELTERLETSARQALDELTDLRPTEGYANSTYRDLVGTLQKLERCADAHRYAVQRDRGMM